MATIIQLKRGRASVWASQNPVLAPGEIGLETDTRLMKAGDGVTQWNSLPYTSIALDIDSALSDSSTNPVQNKVVKAAIDKVSPLKLNAAPTTATEGSVGQFAVDTTTSKVYILLSIGGTEQTPEYNWDEVLNASQKGVANGIPTLDGNGQLTANQLPVIHGSSAPTTSTAGVIGQMYSDDTNVKTYTCVSIGGTQEAPVYNWKEGVYLGSDGKIASEQLPVAGEGVFGIIKTNIQNGMQVTANGTLATYSATQNGINLRLNQFAPIVPNNLDYAVRSVSPNVTVIPAATSAYSLLDYSATTNDHSMTYQHEPSAAPTYTLPAVSNDALGTVHEIVLTVKFSANVLSFSFLDSGGNTIVPLSEPELAAGMVVSFLCKYEPLLSKWAIMPVVMTEEA